MRQWIRDGTIEHALKSERPRKNKPEVPMHTRAPRRFHQSQETPGKNSQANRFAPNPTTRPARTARPVTLRVNKARTKTPKMGPLNNEPILLIATRIDGEMSSTQNASIMARLPQRSVMALAIPIHRVFGCRCPHRLGIKKSLTVVALRAFNTESSDDIAAAKSAIKARPSQPGPRVSIMYRGRAILKSGPEGFCGRRSINCGFSLAYIARPTPSAQ